MLAALPGRMHRRADPSAGPAPAWIVECHSSLLTDGKKLQGGHGVRETAATTAVPTSGER